MSERVDLRSWRDRIGLFVLIGVGVGLLLAAAGWVYWSQLRKPSPAAVCDHMEELFERDPSQQGLAWSLVSPLEYEGQAPPAGDFDTRCRWFFSTMERVGPDYGEVARCIDGRSDMFGVMGCVH